MPRNLLSDGRDPIPRHLLGRARRAASIELAKVGRKPSGHPLWAKRTKLEPVKDRAHQLAVVRYLRNHAANAAVWTDVTRA